MKQGQTNVGKKEQRQVDQRLTKAAQEGRTEANDVQKRVVPKQHRLKGRRGQDR